MNSNKVIVVAEAGKAFLTKENITITEALKNAKKLAWVAKEAGAKYIISGDKHLLALKEFKGIKIVSVDKFLSIGN